MRGIFLLLALTAFVSARYVVKRNAYGDEQVTPAPQPVVEVTEAAPVEEAPVVVPQETPAPAPAPAPVPDCNVAPAPVAPEAPAVVDSGYRSKRNAYGDEQVTPAAEPVVEVTEAAPVEEAPVVVPQETPAPAPAPAPVPDCNVAPAPVAPEAPAVVDSGYRSKRNAYGDEQVTPAAEPVVEVTEAAPVEEAPVVVPQETPAPAPVPDCNVAPAPVAPEAPAVVDSGYRAKRNAYGDEQVTPAAEPVVEVTEAAPVEEAPVVVPQETPAPAPAPAPVPDCNVAPAPAAPEAPAVVDSGYRSKRNAYGDEQVTPAAEPVVEVTEAAPVEEAPVVVPQETPAPAPAPAPAPVPDCNVAPAPAAPEAPAVVDSGYRSKRNAYGDEQVTPAAEPVVEVTEAAPVEEAPVVVPQETPAPAPAPAPVPDCNVAPAPVAPEAPAVVDSGYRSKRNAYGDEQVTPAAEPVVEVTEAAPVEEAPVVVPQETPAPAPAPAPVPDCNVAPAPAAPETPAVVDSGYRSKRNAYGDEQVTPAPEPVVEATEAAPVEEAPVVVPQETPAPAPVPDCNVAPAPAATEAPAVEESGYRS